MLSERDIEFIKGEEVWDTEISDRPFLDGESYELSSSPAPSFDWIPPIGEPTPLAWWNSARVHVKNLNDALDHEVALKWAMLGMLTQMPAIMSTIWQVKWAQLVTEGEKMGLLDNCSTTWLPAIEDEDEIEIVPDTEE